MEVGPGGSGMGEHQYVARAKEQPSNTKWETWELCEGIDQT